jgi:spore maturation protein CgeB
MNLQNIKVAPLVGASSRYSVMEERSINGCNSSQCPVSIRVLYLASNSGTSRHRALSLKRLGHEVQILDPRSFLPQSRLLDYWTHHTGALGLENFIRSRILEIIRSTAFDLVWVDPGEFVCPELVRDLKRKARFVINYNVDDPYGARDGKKWRLYIRAIPFYDLAIVVRDCNLAEAHNVGAREVMRVHRSSDEVAHAPRPLSLMDQSKWRSEVAFIGTWMPERGPFLARLVERGVPLAIWGDRWPKAKEWPILRAHWRGPGLYNDDDYAKAVQCAKVCLGLLSKGNRDTCTQRSFEIPQLGGVLCAERTSEHLALYTEGVDAVFWNDADECAQKCNRLLNDEPWRSQLAGNGRKRAMQNGTSNETVMNQIISRVFDSVPSEAPIPR